MYYLTKPHFFSVYEKHPQSLLYNIAASMWGLLMFYLIECYYLHLWLIIFEVGDGILKACKYEKRWCEPGSNTTQCLRGPTKAQWYTDKHGTFSTQTNVMFSSITLLVHSCSHGSQSKTLKVGALPMYWSTFTLSYSSPIQLPEMPDKIHSSLQSKPQALHGHWPSIHARHDTACPCNNSLLTLRF